MSVSPGPQSEAWRAFVEDGHAISAFLRRVFRLAPASPRCATCYAPFKGFGGRMLRITPFQQSRKAPRFCKLCCEGQPLGGAEAPTGVLFADMRGYTAMAEHALPGDVAKEMNRFYAIASDVLVAHDALIDKLIGDEVMALFLPGFSGRDYIEKMVSAALQLLERLGAAALSVGVGLDHGIAWVGNVGTDDISDFTALGDVVNTAARLQALARPGEMIMSEQVYALAGERLPDATARTLELKGKSEPIRAYTIDVHAQRTGA